ncbi:ATP-binding protein [Candidatus Neomarinimicrobiota bacterium]
MSSERWETTRHAMNKPDRAVMEMQSDMKRQMRQELAQHEQAEKKLQQYCDHLEELLKERTDELKRINEQFQQEITDRKRAEKELSDLERRQLEAEKIIALGQVAAGVAHEINNPLASIKNCFHIVKGVLPQGHGIEQFVRFIERDIERIAAIVREMYNLYQPPHAAVGPISINEVLGDVLAAMEGALSACAVVLQDERCTGDLDVVLPTGQLAQIFTNIINNALDAMQEGGLLRVKTRQQNECVLVEVADSGEGIPPDVLPHIFEPFFSTKSPAVGKGVRMGLGLSVTRSLVNSLGGHISVKTEPGAGTCVTVSLPIESCTESKGETGHE